LARNSLASILLGCAGVLIQAAELHEVSPPEATISNGIIKARLYLPNAKSGYYRGTRFDWSGVIYRLQYKRHDYYGPWYQKQRAEVHDFRL
jgi:hypothetical protein